MKTPLLFCTVYFNSRHINVSMIIKYVFNLSFKIMGLQGHHGFNLAFRKTMLLKVVLVCQRFNYHGYAICVFFI